MAKDHEILSVTVILNINNRKFLGGGGGVGTTKDLPVSAPLWESAQCAPCVRYVPPTQRPPEQPQIDRSGFVKAAQHLPVTWEPSGVWARSNLGSFA